MSEIRFPDGLGDQPRILVVRRDNIGDLVCTIPLIAALRERYPGAYLAALVNSYNAPVLSGHPALDQVFLYDKFKHLSGGGSWLRSLFARLRMIGSLRQRAFDLVVIATPLPSRHWFRAARMAGGREVLAMTCPDYETPGWVSRKVSAPENLWQIHAVEQNLALLSSAGLEIPPGEMRIYPDPKLLSKARERLDALSADTDSKVVGIHISARKISQRWPADRFGTLIRRLHEASGCRFVLFWSPGSMNNPRHPGDDEKALEVIAATEGLPLLPMPTGSLPELIAGLAVVDRMVCSDGGAMHLAAALGKPIICLFGDSDPNIWHPWGVPYRLIQPNSRNVGEVQPEAILAAFLDLENSLC